MASRSGGTPIKTNKVRSGPDQAFTLPKGTSAAPIKGAGMGTKLKKTFKNAKKKDLDLGAAIIGFGITGGTGAAVLGEKAKKRRVKKQKLKKLNSVGTAKRGYGKAIR